MLNKPRNNKQSFNNQRLKIQAEKNHITNHMAILATHTTMMKMRRLREDVRKKSSKMLMKSGESKSSLSILFLLEVLRSFSSSSRRSYSI